MKPNNLSKLIAAVLVSELAGVIGSVFTNTSTSSWYVGIVKPTLNPPSWVFGPVWTALFLLMGIAVFLIYRSGWEKNEVRTALGIFGIQLILNMAWSVIFFGLYSPGAALIEIISLWLAIVATIIVFSRISRPAAWLLAPYILWVSFAVYLNYSIWMLN